MHFSSPLLTATLVRRYQRFLAEVKLADGSTTIVHCPNTGSLLGCAESGMRVWLSRSSNPRRKYSLTWELVEVANGTLAGINTGLANRLVEEAITQGHLADLSVYSQLRREVKFGRQGSRVDFVLEAPGRPACYLEVKNVNAAVEAGIALFPDAVSARATRHLQELMTMIDGGQRSVLCFCVQRGDVHEVRPADAIDPVYGRALRQAIAHGVEVKAVGYQVTTQSLTPHRLLPVVCP